VKAVKLIPLVVVAAGLLVYSDSFTGGFCHDDFRSIPKNPTIRHLWPIWQCLSPVRQNWLTAGGGRPVINLSLAINYALGGYQVWGYHALNLAVHILAGLTLFGIVRRTLLTPTLVSRFGAAANELALATAVLWMVHPLQTESVTYIIQRAESIMGLFYLLTLYCFIRGVESPHAEDGKWMMGNGSCRLHSRLWYSLSVTACASGMASKEVMVSAPLMVLLYDRAFVSGSFREAWRQRWPLYVALASTWILLGVVEVCAGIFAYASTAAQPRYPYRWWEYLATQPGVILYYLRLSVWPSPLCLNHPWPAAKTWVRILPPAVVVVTLLAGSVWGLTRKPASTPRSAPVWGFVGAWFFLILAPSSSFIPLYDPIYEHRMYLSLAAVVSVVVVGLYWLVGRRSLVVWAVVVIGLGFLTWRRNQDYRSEVALWADTVAKFPNEALERYNFGVALAKVGRTQEAIHQLEQTLRLDPSVPGAHYNLGLALEQEGHAAEAIEQYEQAVRMAPAFAEAHYSLGTALEEAGRNQEAIAQYEQALRVKPDFAKAYNNLGVALWRAGKTQEAQRCYEQAIRIRPDFDRAHYNLGFALSQHGDIQGAIAHYELALKFDPDYADAHHNLGVVLMQTGHLQDAIGHYREALRLKPDDSATHYGLGLALWEAGDAQAAIQQWDTTVRINPDYVDAHKNLGNAFLQLGAAPKAVEHFAQVLRLCPNVAEAHYDLGVAFEQAGRAREAREQYEQALRLKPGYTDAQTRLTRLRTAP